MKKFAVWALALVGLALVIAVVRGNTPEGRSRIAGRMAIEECRKTENDPLLDRSARLLARGACEELERRFREKHNASP
jgi:hypothetical protein